jgi:hypothetical protein
MAALIMWSAGKQNNVTMSSTESEYRLVYARLSWKTSAVERVIAPVLSHLMTVAGRSSVCSISAMCWRRRIASHMVFDAATYSDSVEDIVTLFCFPAFYTPWIQKPYSENDLESSRSVAYELPLLP